MNVNSEYSSLIEAWVLSANEDISSIEAWDKILLIQNLQKAMLCVHLSGQLMY